MSEAYKIRCLDCASVYLGQTMQLKNKGFYQHVYGLKKSNHFYSSLCQHFMDNKQKPDR